SRRAAGAAGGVAAPPRTAPRARPGAACVVELRPSSDGASITSTMFPVKVDRAEPVELHEQVAAEIRRAIADGEAKPGERLPPARDLAAVLGVNANTVLRALRMLRDAGLLDFTRGRGVTVCGTPAQGSLLTRAQELLSWARRHGYNRGAVLGLIETLA